MKRNIRLVRLCLPVIACCGLAALAPPAQAQRNGYAQQDPAERQRQRQELRQQIFEQRARAMQERGLGGVPPPAPIQQGTAVAPGGYGAVQGGYAGPQGGYAASYGAPGYRGDGTPRLSIEERQQLRRQLREARGHPMGPDPVRP